MGEPAVIIKINGDIKNFHEALDEAKDHVESLSDDLKGIAKTAGAAFAALTGEVLLSAHAFSESVIASNKLVNSLQNQGIYSKELLESYKQTADRLQALTGIDNDRIITAQAVIQAQIGQQVVTGELTEAIISLSKAKEMDLNSTADLIAKGINGHLVALERLNIHVEAGLSQQERTAKIIEIVRQRYGDLATATGANTPTLQKLSAAFEDIQKQIGQYFDPILKKAIGTLTEFLKSIGDNKALVEFIAVGLAAGAVVTGLITTVALGGIAFLKLQAALQAAGVATSVLTLGVRALVGATGIGLLLILIGEIALHWDTIWPRMVQIFQAFAGSIGAIGSGIGKILAGMFNPNLGLIKQGLAEVKTAISKGWDDAWKDLKPPVLPVPAEGAGQDEEKARAAAKAEAIRKERQRVEIEGIKAHNAVVVSEATQQTQRIIDIQKAEADLLDKLQDEKYAKVKSTLQARLAELRQIESDQQADDLNRQATFNDEILAQNKEYNDLTDTQKQAFRIQEQQGLISQLETENSIREKAAKDEIKKDLDRKNQMLENQRKFGAAYAQIYALMHNEIADGTKSSLSELEQLQGSSNSTLKSIGKAAAIANIIMATQESAMNIYKGFSVIPFIGPELGIAGAAAAIAYGGERVAQVIGAADGGLITGGIPGVDSVPLMAQHGELVVPTRSFDEVVNAVASQRVAQQTGQAQASAGGRAVIEVMFNPKKALDWIEAKLVERQALNISIQGAR